MEFSVSKTFSSSRQLSDKARLVMRMFGLTADRLDKISFRCGCDITIEAGHIVYITGSSGSGKSVLLGQMKKTLDRTKSVNLAQIPVRNGKAVIDCIEADLVSSLKFFTAAGLGDCSALLNEPANLSDGQKMRFRLALALASGKKFLFADEFCSNLDRLTAACISHNVRKFANRHKVTFFLASAHQDILLDLAPDVIITTNLSGKTDVTYKYLSR